MNTHDTYYKLAALEAIDSLYYPFDYQRYDPNYPVLQESAGALGMIGTRLICNIAFENRDNLQAKIAHTVLPIVVGFGLYFMTAKKGDTLKTCLYNYKTQMLSHILQSVIHFTPQKSIDEQVKDLCPEVILNFFPQLKKKEIIGPLIHQTINSYAFERPKGFPTGLVVLLASEGLNGVLQSAAQKLITPVAQRIVAEKVDIFVTSILGTFATHYIAPLIKQLPVCSGFFASLGPSKMSPIFLASYAFATAVKENIWSSLWTSDTKS